MMSPIQRKKLVFFLSYFFILNIVFVLDLDLINISQWFVQKQKLVFVYYFNLQNKFKKMLMDKYKIYFPEKTEETVSQSIQDKS